MVVERDKRTIAVNTEEGLVENVYTLQLSNTDEKVHTVIISASGIDGIKIVGKSEVELDPASTDTKIVRVRVDPQKAKAAGVGADGTPIVFHLKSPETGEDLEYKSIYYLPKE